MKVLITIILALTFSACTSPKKRSRSDVKVEMKSNELNATKEFEVGMKLMDEMRYADAAATFDRLLVQKPASEIDLVILFNSGSAYEGMGKCQEASDRYRKVIRSSSGKFKGIEGQALFRLSLAYECMGQDTKAVTSLLDTLRRAKDLPPEIMKAEIPARIAAAYARLGNRNKALEYFDLAGKGLKQLISDRTRNKVPLARTIYLMGQLSQSQRDMKMDPIAYAQSLFIQQPYLLQAMEIGHPEWSPKAAEDLVTAYDNIWQYQVADNQRSEFFVRAMQNLTELKRLKLRNSSDLVEETFQKLGKMEGRIQSELAKTSVSTTLTPEAEKREGLRREGRVVGPATELEKKSPTKKK